jgi:hypothetical protein
MYCSVYGVWYVRMPRYWLNVEQADDVLGIVVIGATDIHSPICASLRRIELARGATPLEQYGRPLRGTQTAEASPSARETQDHLRSALPRKGSHILVAVHLSTKASLAVSAYQCRCMLSVIATANVINLKHNHTAK